eukprot:87610_1
MAQTSKKQPEQPWQTKLDNIFNAATIESNKDKHNAIALFLQCIELEASNTEIIDKRFYSMKQILLLQSQDCLSEDDTQILNRFQQLLNYYDPANPSFEYVSSNDMHNTLRLLFNSLRDYNNINTLIQLVNVAYKHFESINTESDELLQMNIAFTLKLLQKEYIDKLDMKYVANIQPCDEYDMWNAINDFDNKIVIDLGTQQQFMDKHINYAINIDMSKEFDDEYVFNIVFECIKDKRSPEIYCYRRSSTRDATPHDQKEELQTDHADETQQIQHLIWRNTKRIIPCYVCTHDFNALSNKYYPFLCESGGKERYIECDKQRQSGYPNHIINDRLYLGNLKQVTNDEILKTLNITHIVNCTSIHYHNHITKAKDQYLQIKVTDTYYAPIEMHFERAYKFIDDALQNTDNKVLCHCRSGMSRSATIVISYLMKKNNMNLDDALHFVKRRRSKVQPNGGFMQQLQKYQAVLQH